MREGGGWIGTGWWLAVGEAAGGVSAFWVECGGETEGSATGEEARSGDDVKTRLMWRRRPRKDRLGLPKGSVLCLTVYAGSLVYATAAGTAPAQPPSTQPPTTHAPRPMPHDPCPTLHVHTVCPGTGRCLMTACLCASVHTSPILWATSDCGGCRVRRDAWMLAGEVMIVALDRYADTQHVPTHTHTIHAHMCTRLQ